MWTQTTELCTIYIAFSLFIAWRLSIEISVHEQNNYSVIQSEQAIGKFIDGQ